MTTGYFHNEERIARLVATSFRWVGTPWFANSNVRGVGVACHLLPRQILIECGALPESFPKPKGDPTQTRHSKTSLMDVFLDAQPLLARVDLAVEPTAPGDILGLRIYGCIDHLGLALDLGTFIHVLMHKNTDIDNMSTPPWQQRIEAAWRVL